jgi:hypothetical protein
MDATAGVVLQSDDGFELTKEVNAVAIMISLRNDSTILCLSVLLAVNSMVPNTVNNTCRI